MWSRKLTLPLNRTFRADKDCVERRKESRLKIKQDVTITVLGQVGASTMRASVLEISGSGMRLSVAAKIPCGAGIKIDSKNALVLAEVSRCVREGQFYTVAVTLLHSLSVFKDLEVLNRALFGEECNRGKVASPARS
jgi:c-di-GMP-binding flagellar brake protein YcgR